jgi:acid phosphatase
VEYHASALQIYRSARVQLDKAMISKSWTAEFEQVSGYEHLPPAIVMDIDETVLDSSVYQARQLAESADSGTQSWDEWISLQQAVAVPGAVEFIEYATDRGIDIFYVTNRVCLQRQDKEGSCPQELDTVENLRAVGITDSARAENLLLKNEKPTWGAEKLGRRQYVASRYRILLLFGDQLSDFIPCVRSRNSSECANGSSTPGERENKMNYHADKWGQQWFILPNPMYGSWLKILP